MTIYENLGDLSLGMKVLIKKINFIDLIIKKIF